MRVYVKSPRVIAVKSITHSLILKQLKRDSKDIAPAVAVEIVPNEQVNKQSGYKPLINKEIFGFLGLINIDNDIYLAMITHAVSQVANPVKYESVNRIYSVDFVSLTSDEWDNIALDAHGRPLDASGVADDVDDINGYNGVVHPCHELRKLLSNGSFYYSDDFDLTSLLQNRGLSGSKLSGDGGMSSGTIKLEHYQTEYMWNSFLMDELIKFRANLDPFVQEILDNNKFLTTVIRGFAKTIAVNPSGDFFTIVSKQSWKRAGTRFNARGINDDGDVANFVETEFIYDSPSKGSIFAFTQIRGSVPAFWEQDTTLMNPKITLTRSKEATQPIFDKHFTDVCKKHGVCHIVNLLSRTKPAEAALSKRYKELLQDSTHRKDISFSEFDFHHETKQSGGFAGAAKILPLLFESLERFGWFQYDLDSQEVIIRQDGVFRTNCLDCLDRTNLIQQVICQNVLEIIMANNSGEYVNAGRGLREDILARYNSIWADNGDAVSQIYTGTNALKSSFSRSGKMNFAGALSDVTKSVSRMYQNTFMDNKKQSTMDLLLGYDARNSLPVKIHDPINDYVQEKLKEQESVFTTYSDIHIFVGTYNLNAAAASKNIDLTSWLFPPENAERATPDIYAIGLQELIELNAGAILTANSSKPTEWAKLINQQLNSQGESYYLLRTEAIASMSVLLFVKQSQLTHVTQVAGSSKKTGLGGMAANKGACAVRFQYGVTSFVLLTSHLAAGSNAVIERSNDYQTIIQGMRFTRNYSITDHDHVVWFGDLNYRISVPNEQCRYLIENGAFDELQDMDQLIDEMRSKGAFHGFKEGAIKFYPTYKFDRGTSNYDSSEKQRVPSWTDRILYMSSRSSDALQQLNYNSLMEIYVSDHKPVYSTFKSRVKFVDSKKEIELAKQIYNGYKFEHSDNGDASLLDFSDSMSSSSKATTSSNSTNFTTETLAELNLLDATNDGVPKLPERPGPQRRKPPVPPSRSQQRSASGSLSRKPPPFSIPVERSPEPQTSHETPVPQKTQPPPPPRRRAPQSGEQLNWNFSSAPLVPNKSNSSTPRSSSPLDSTKTGSQAPMKPIVPSKPAILSAQKTNVAKFPSESTLSLNSNEPHSLSKTNSTNNVMNMSDWKPLVPK